MYIIKPEEQAKPSLHFEDLQDGEFFTFSYPQGASDEVYQKLSEDAYVRWGDGGDTPALWRPAGILLSPLVRLRIHKGAEFVVVEN